MNDFRRNAQLGGDDLRVGGLVALTLRDGAHAGDSAAGGVDADFAGVEHANTQDVADLGRTGTDDFGEGNQTNAHQGGAVRVCAFGLLLCAQSLVVHGFKHFIERGLVVTRVELEPEGALVGELFFLDEVLGADLCLVHAQFLRQHINHALNQVHRFGHAEGAAIRHAAWGLIGVHTFDAGVCRRNVVTARNNVEHAGRKLGRVGTGVKCAMVGHHIHAKASDLAVGCGGEFAVHVVVAGKASARDVFDAVFDPLNRAAQYDGRHDGAYIARVDRHFVAKATTDVGADDTHFGFRNSRQHGHHGAHNVRSL